MCEYVYANSKITHTDSHEPEPLIMFARQIEQIQCEGMGSMINDMCEYVYANSKKHICQ